MLKEQPKYSSEIGIVQMNIKLILILMFIFGNVYSVDIRVLSRFDGVLFEFISEQPMDPVVWTAGYEVGILTNTTLTFPDDQMPFWILNWRVSEDSTDLHLTAVEYIDSLEYALSSDSCMFLLFLQTSEPLEFPGLSWNSPPSEYSEPIIPYLSDTVAYNALAAGRESPWLQEFDRIVIDPGHGGRDPGAIGPRGTYEKDRNLEIALLTRDILSIVEPDIEVLLTREIDEYVSLGSRTRFANASHADLFVSIHCNASTRSDANGFETFFLSEARNNDARAVELLENSVADMDSIQTVINIADDPLAFLLADIAQNIYLERSSSLAVEIQASLANTFESNENRGVKQAGFYVLRGALMPSVLIEVAFISNPAEENMLESIDFRLKTAEAIVQAILLFKLTGYNND